jgi:K+-transporting ATPase ATPase C chain
MIIKQYILPAIKLTLLCVLFFSGIYPLFIWLIAQAAPGSKNGETITVNNKIVGYALEGQSFTKDDFFWGRPSAVGYNAAGSGGTNKSPFNKDYLKDVQAKIDSFLVHNPTVKKEEIPVEMVTYSASGIDPDISPEAAYIQVNRVAAARKIDQEKIKQLVDAHIQRSTIAGVDKINVLKLNIALNELSSRH